MKKLMALLLAAALVCALIPLAVSADTDPVLADGIYSAVFDTDSSMFHVNSALDGRGILTVRDGSMTIHITLESKSILQLFPGLKEDAQKEGAALLDPTVDEVVYPDGYADKAHGFDVPVPVLGEEFDLALIGKKGVWYDHKVSVSDPVPYVPEDGVYSIEVILGGGSGKSTVLTPCTLTVEDGAMTARIVWSSSKYDYMIVDDVKYEPVTLEGGSTFEIPVSILGAELPVIADTIAMSTPHEIEYTLTFSYETLQPVSEAA